MTAAVMYSILNWRADGLRWLATILNRAADALERPEAPVEMQPPFSASAACDEARSRGAYRVPYY